MQGDIIIYDIKSREQFPFLLTTEGGQGSFSFSGVPSLALNKANQEAQDGDFSSGDTFAQSNWDGQYENGQQIGASRVKRWASNKLSYNIFPTSSFWKSNQVDVLREPGEIRLGLFPKLVSDQAETYVSSFNKCGTFGVIPQGSSAVRTTSDGITFTDKDIAPSGELYRYDPENKIYITKSDNTLVDSQGGAGYTMFDDAPVVTVTDSTKDNSNYFGDREDPNNQFFFDPALGVIKVKVTDYENYGIGQRIKLSGVVRSMNLSSTDGQTPYLFEAPSNFEETYYVVGIEGPNIYLSSKKIKVVGDASGFKGSTANGNKIIYQYEDQIDDIGKTGSNVIYTNNAKEINFSHTISEPELYDGEDSGFASVNIADNAVIAKGVNTLAPLNVYGTIGLDLGAPYVVTYNDEIVVHIKAGEVRDENGNYSSISEGIIRSDVHAQIFIYAIENSLVHSPVPVEDDRAILLYTIYHNLERVAEQTNTAEEPLDPDQRTYVFYNKPSFREVVDNRPNVMNFNIDNIVTLEALDTVIEVDLDPADIDSWRENNRFLLEANGGTFPYESVMEYEDGKVRIVAQVGPSIGVMLNRKTNYTFPDLERPTSIDTINNDSFVIGGMNKLYYYSHGDKSSLHDDGSEKSGESYKEYEFNTCENIHEFAYSMDHSEDAYFVGTRPQIGGVDQEWGRVFIVTPDSFIDLAPFNDGPIWDLFFNKFENSLYVASGEVLYKIFAPTSSNRKIIKLEEFESDIRSLSPFKNGVLVNEGENVYLYNEEGVWQDLYHVDDRLLNSYPYKNGTMSITRDGKFYTTSYDLNELAMTGTLESSIYSGTTPALNKHFTYAKVIVTNWQDGDQVELYYKTSKMNDFEVVNGLEFGDPACKFVCEGLDPCEKIFNFPSNTISKDIQYKIQLTRGGITNDPGVTHIAMAYNSVEQKELYFKFSIDLSKVIEGVRGCERHQQTLEMYQFLKCIWDNRKMVFVTTPLGDQEYMIPYSLPNDATNGFSVIADNWKFQADKCPEDASLIVTMSFKSIYPLHGCQKN